MLSMSMKCLRMNKENIDDLIKELEKERKEIAVDKYKLENLERLKKIAVSYSGIDEVVSFQSIAKKIKEDEALGKEEEKMITGFATIDRILKGFRPEQLIVLSGVTGNGKTSFSMELSERLKEFNPLWFPFEESAYELVRKCLERGYEPPKAFTPNSLEETNIKWMKTKIVESIAKYNTKIVFIDHLEYIVPKGFDEVQETSKVMRELKGIAKEFGIVVFLLCHLKKVKIDSQPTTEDVKGSTSVTQQADTVFLLWRETKRENGEVISTNNTNISIQKNRRFGETGNIKMEYKNGRFLETEWMSDKEQSLQDFKDF